MIIEISKGLVINECNYEDCVDQAVNIVENSDRIRTDCSRTLLFLRVAVKRLSNANTIVVFENGVISKMNNKGMLSEWSDDSIVSTDFHAITELVSP